MITFLVPCYRAAMGSEYDRLLALAQEVTNPLTPFHVGCQFQFGSLLRGDSPGPQRHTERHAVNTGKLIFLRLFHPIWQPRRLEESCCSSSALAPYNAISNVNDRIARHQDPNSSSSMVNTPHVVAIPGGVRVQGICPGLIPLPAPVTQP
ncbi:unnamed protein product [Boreogadus saida]